MHSNLIFKKEDLHIYLHRTVDWILPGECLTIWTYSVLSFFFNQLLILFLYVQFSYNFQIMSLVEQSNIVWLIVNKSKNSFINYIEYISVVCMMKIFVLHNPTWNVWFQVTLRYIISHLCIWLKLFEIITGMNVKIVQLHLIICFKTQGTHRCNDPSFHGLGCILDVVHHHLFCAGSHGTWTRTWEHQGRRCIRCLSIGSRSYLLHGIR